MNEQISALLDDEIAAEDAAHIITAAQLSKQGAEAWSQYHLIGDAMRGNAVLSRQFKQSLMQKIEMEAIVLSPNAALINQVAEVKRKNAIPVTWSIAASFAAVMMVGWLVLHQSTQNGHELAPVEVAQAVITNESATDQAIPAEYLSAHQASAPSASSYYIQTVNFKE
jgi:sigma-E factor negative regulatory protein RseA